MQKHLLILLMLAISFLNACAPATKQASWITHPESSEGENLWLSFRKDFAIGSLGASEYTAHIAVDSKYWLWINGELAIFEGGLKRGPHRNGIYYDVVDLKPYLVEGKNNISLLMWHFGRHGFSHYNSGKAGLYFDLQAGRNTLVSDSTWKVAVHPSFGPSAPPYPNYRLPEFNIHFDARKDISGWNLPGFDDTAWAYAGTLGNAGDAPFGEMVKRPFANWRDSGLIEYVSIEEKVVDGKKVIHAHLPVNSALTPWFRIDAPEGLLIDVRTDNYVGGSEINLRTEYVTRQGVQEFETPGYINGHYVIYTFPEEVEILDLKYRDTRYAEAYVAHFEANDPFYNTLWQKSLNTMWVNLRDAIQDPDRERAQWWGDVVILIGQMLYVLEDNGQGAIEKAIRNLVDWQKEDGSLFSPIPAGTWDAELPTQMLASVGKMGFWNYYQYTANEELMKYVYPSVKKYLQLWELDDRGLVKHRPGGWTWLDWGQKIDSTLVFNTWYYMALEGAQGMAELTGDSEFYNECEKKLQTLYESFNAHLWDGTGYRSANYQFEYDDRGNGLAVLSGLANETKYDALASLLEKYFNSSPYIEKYVMESLFKMNKADQALERMKNRYTKMVESPVTTLWEGWGIGPEGYGGGSYNHGWSGGPLNLMARYVAGVQPLTPGFESLLIKPQPGTLTSVNCTVNTVQGMIDVSWKKENQSFLIQILNEAGTTAHIIPPVENREKVQSIWANGVKIWDKDSSGDPMAGVSVEFSETGDPYLQIQKLESMSLEIHYKMP
jgi:alpha-L-rhamnosidase